MRESKLVDALQALGFTIYEAKTYLALLRLGAPANGYEAARAAGIPTSKIYETLRRLSEKGAVMVNTSAPITYAPVPHRDLTARLRDRSEATLATVEMGLAAIPAGGEPSLTWTIAGADNVVARMRQLVQRAEQTSSFGSEIFYGFALQGTGRPTTDLQDCHCFFGCKFHRETEAS